MKKRRTVYTTKHSGLSARIYDAIKNARDHYTNNKQATASPIQKCEDFVNSYRHEADILQQFVETHWLKRMPTGHFYIQLL